MTSPEIFLVVISVLLLVAVTVLSIKSHKRKLQIKNLKDSIEQYFEKNTLTKFSTKDDSFAPLQNAVCDLENALELEKHNTKTQARKNSDFIADISHQLKTPLAGLRLYVEMDKAQNIGEHTDKELQLIEKTEELIAKLLLLEKIKADAYTMNFQLYEIHNIVNSIVCDFKLIYPEKQYIVFGESKLRCDKEWIIEAIGNVIKNSCEHTAPDGKIEIFIEKSEKSTSVTVCDNGGGVEESEIGKLFDRFHRTKNAKPQSAGIGLAITKAIVEKHHGTVCAQNTREGLCIIMCFPHIDGYETI